MEYLSLGKNGPVVSKICFGSLAVSGPGVSSVSQDGAEVIAYALLRGINFIDTAQYYENYEVIRRGIELYRRVLDGEYARSSAAFSFFEKLPHDLRRRIEAQREIMNNECVDGFFPPPEKIVISSKSYAYDAAGAEAAVDEARKALGRDVIDVFLLHEQESEDTLRGHREALEYYLRCRERGIIRSVGLSTHCVAAARAAARFEHSRGRGLDIVFAMYNHTGLGIRREEDGGKNNEKCKMNNEKCSAKCSVFCTVNNEKCGASEGLRLPGNIAARREMYDALKECHDSGMGVMLMKVFGGGNLLGRSGDDTVSYAERALRFAVGCDAADVLALGMQSFEQVDADIAYCERGAFPSDFSPKTGRRRLEIDDYCAGCGSCVARCGQSALSIVGGRAVCDAEKCVLCGYCAAVCPLFAIHQREE